MGSEKDIKKVSKLTNLSGNGTTDAAITRDHFWFKCKMNISLAFQDEKNQEVGPV